MSQIFDPLAIEYYKIVKDYAKHEDSLVNNRLSWAMGVSSAMILAIGAIVASEVSGSHPRLTIFAIFGLSCVGFITTVSCGFGIYAAMTALKCLSSHWDKFADDHRERLGNVKFPSILGGGHDGEDWLTRLVSWIVKKPYDMGLYYPHFILAAFFIIWVVIISVSVYHLLVM